MVCRDPTEMENAEPACTVEYCRPAEQGFESTVSWYFSTSGTAEWCDFLRLSKKRVWMVFPLHSSCEELLGVRQNAQ